MKILHIYRQHPGDTGSDIFLDELSRELSKKGHNVLIFTSDLKKWYHNFDICPIKYEKKNQITIVRVPYTLLRFINPRFTNLRNYSKLRLLDKFFFKLERGLTKCLRFIFEFFNHSILWGLFQDELGWKALFSLNKQKADLIHTTAIPRSLIVASLLFAKKNNITSIVTPFYHYNEKEFYSYDKYWMKILNMFDCINVCTEAEKNYLVSHGINKNKIIKIGLGVYFQKYNKDQENLWRKKLNISKEAFVVLFINAHIYDSHKGVLEVIKAAIKLPQIEFIFAGNDRQLWDLMIKENFQGENLENCYYVGYVTGENKSSLYNAVDIIARPSVNEALGIVYLEAMSAGKPIITSNIDSMKEISKNVGLSVEFGNVQELLEAILRMKSDKQLYQKFSYNAIEKSKLYSWEVVSKKFENLYKILNK